MVICPNFISRFTKNHDSYPANSLKRKKVKKKKVSILDSEIRKS